MPCAQLLLVADAGQHQQLRGVDRAAGEHHLLAGADRADRAALHVLDPDGGRSLEQHPGRGGLGEHSQVGALARGREVGVGRAPAGAALLGDHRLQEALGLSGVRALHRESRLPRRLQVGAGERSGGALPAHRQRAGGAGVVGGGAFHVLDPAEVLHHLAEGPGVVGEFGPLVVVGGEAAHPHHGVHRRGTAERLPSRPVDAAAAESGLRLGQVVPVDLAAEQLGEGRGNVDVLVLVRRTCLEEDDLGARVGAEPAGQRGAGRSRADDDVVGD
ncbi:hypothetical protein C8K38_12354 [Rhodococcus sp. OK611]|nr:hypothetical protein C8K38_12354 [Rhodococcus sp. OK611]SNX93755.1 hypothetical protein SAMN05447004_12354 [Rhodococcus sp. OK270]